MKKNTGKKILCIIASVLLILGGSYLMKLSKEVNDRMARLKKGEIIEVTLTEHPKGNYNSDTTEYLWNYSYVNADGKTVTSSTVGRYTKQELQATNYRMNIYVKGNDSMEEPYLLNEKKADYNGTIIFYCLAVLPLAYIVFMIIQRVRYEEVLEKGTIYYAKFLEAFREGAYYKIKFSYEVDGKTIIKKTQAAFSYGAVEVFKNNGVLEIKHYKNRAAISQKILGIKV